MLDEEVIYAEATLTVECPKCKTSSQMSADEMVMFTEKYYGSETIGIEVRCPHCKANLCIRG